MCAIFKKCAFNFVCFPFFTAEIDLTHATAALAALIKYLEVIMSLKLKMVANCVKKKNRFLC